MKGLSSYALLLFIVLLSGQSSARDLTEEEEALAKEAKAQIAHTIENNVIRMLAAAVAQNEDNYWHRQARQDDDDDEVAPPFNPNVLPQVAQIVGAIFSGGLNLTRVVDGSFGLVPNIVRTQVQGLVKLITGENIGASSSKEGTTEPDDPIIEEGPPSTVVPLMPKTTPMTAAEVVEAATVTTEVVTAPSTTKASVAKYRVRTKTKRTTTVATEKTTVVVDDEIDKVERDLRAAGHILEPYEHREPRYYASLLSQILDSVNFTKITKAVPSLFKGATEAFTMLENLGMLEALPGSETLKKQPDNFELDKDEE